MPLAKVLVLLLGSLCSEHCINVKLPEVLLLPYGESLRIKSNGDKKH